MWNGKSPNLFQSSPDPKARCNGGATDARFYQTWFQSSPDPKARCNLARLYQYIHGKQFQSSPDPKARCNADVLVESGFIRQ